jgi:hypothetical protein
MGMLEDFFRYGGGNPMGVLAEVLSQAGSETIDKALGVKKPPLSPAQVQAAAQGAMPAPQAMPKADFIAQGWEPTVTRELADHTNVGQAYEAPPAAVPAPVPTQMAPVQAAPPAPAAKSPAFAGPSFGQRMMNVGRALQGQDTTDYDRIAETRNQTMEFLTRRGMSADDAKIVGSSPALLQAALPSIFAGKGEWKIEKIGEDEYGRPRYEWTNARTLQTKPIGPGEVPGAAPAAAPAASGAAVAPAAAPMPLGTAASGQMAEAVPTGSGALPSPYAVAAPPPGVNPIEFRKQQAAKTAEEMSSAREKAIGAIDTLRRVQELRGLLDKPLEKPHENRGGWKFQTYGDVVGPWAKPVPAPASGGIPGQIVSAVTNLPGQALAAVRNAQGQFDDRIASANSARDQIDTALTGLQSARVKELFGSQNLSDADREAAAKTVGTINATNAEALKKQMESAERDSFNNISRAIAAGTINPDAVPANVVKRGIDLGIFDGSQFRGFKGVKGPAAAAQPAATQPAAQPAAPAAGGKPPQDEAMRQAQAAIAAGRDPAKVRARLREWGYDLP